MKTINLKDLMQACDLYDSHDEMVDKENFFLQDGGEFYEYVCSDDILQENNAALIGNAIKEIETFLINYREEASKIIEAKKLCHDKRCELSKKIICACQEGSSEAFSFLNEYNRYGAATPNEIEEFSKNPTWDEDRRFEYLKKNNL